MVAFMMAIWELADHQLYRMEVRPLGRNVILFFKAIEFPHREIYATDAGYLCLAPSLVVCAIWYNGPRPRDK